MGAVRAATFPIAHRRAGQSEAFPCDGSLYRVKTELGECAGLLFLYPLLVVRMDTMFTPCLYTPCLHHVYIHHVYTMYKYLLFTAWVSHGPPRVVRVFFSMGIYSIIVHSIFKNKPYEFVRMRSDKSFRRIHDNSEVFKS